MTLVELFDGLNATGLTVRRSGPEGMAVVGGVTNLPADIKAALAEHKATLLAIFSGLPDESVATPSASETPVWQPQPEPTPGWWNPEFSDIENRKLDEFIGYPADVEREAICWVEGLSQDDAALVVEQACRAWGELVNDANKIDAQPHTAAPTDWWSRISDRDRRYLQRPRGWPVPCVWCGGRLRHNPLCVSHDWELALPFGKHKGRKISKVPAPYLRWLMRKLRERIDSDAYDLRCAIADSLARRSELIPY